MAPQAPENPQRILDRLDPDRRQFLKKILLTAYVAPFVASFGMKGLGLGEAVAHSNVTVPNSSADLIISKTATPDPVVAGSNLNYSIRVQNCGPATAVNVSVSDPVPAGTTFVSASQTSGPSFSLSLPPVGGTGTFTATLASMNAGDVAIFQLAVHVTP
jgi:uncharacterized repeat protein (TIGR01451 family)